MQHVIFGPEPISAPFIWASKTILQKKSASFITYPVSGIVLVTTENGLNLL
jgi:hypothetical protein